MENYVHAMPYQPYHSKKKPYHSQQRDIGIVYDFIFTVCFSSIINAILFLNFKHVFNTVNYAGMFTSAYNKMAFEQNSDCKSCNPGHVVVPSKLLAEQQCGK
jgi:hypothetical protein